MHTVGTMLEQQTPDPRPGGHGPSPRGSAVTNMVQGFGTPAAYAACFSSSWRPTPGRRSLHQSRRSWRPTSST
ncbi:MAG: hypothetical protein R3A10_11820 [Caldilineaceae bacterium]